MRLVRFRTGDGAVHDGVVATHDSQPSATAAAEPTADPQGAVDSSKANVDGILQCLRAPVGGLFRHVALMHVHGAKLQHPKGASHHAGTHLLVEDRAR